VNTADDIKRLAQAYGEALYDRSDAWEQHDALAAAVDALAGERDALLEALRLVVAIYDQGTTGYLVADAFNKACAAIKKCEEPK
jgi:hypothetical protein